MNTLDPNLVINFLNNILELDRNCISSLIDTRLNCNNELANHETVQVSGEENNYSIGLLGILNGLCGKDENDWGFIVAEVDENNIVQKFSHSKEKSNECA